MRLLPPGASSYPCFIRAYPWLILFHKTQESAAGASPAALSEMFNLNGEKA